MREDENTDRRGMEWVAECHLCEAEHGEDVREWGAWVTLPSMH